MNDPRLFVKAKCPYCGNINQVTVNPRGELSPVVVLCDIEDSNGCDNYFAITVIFRPDVTVYAMKQFDGLNLTETESLTETEE